MCIEDTDGYREMVVRLLRTLSSEAEQREYQRTVRCEVGTELVCQWFDDLYHPDDATFRSLFSADEQQAMVVFNTAFSEGHPQLPSSGIVAWYGNPVWQHIGRAATIALASFKGDLTERD